MSLANVWYPHAIDLPSHEVTHFSSVSTDRGHQIVTQMVQGKARPCYVGVSRNNPSISFSTMQIKSVLDAINTGDDALGRISLDLSASTSYLYYKAGKPMGIRETDATAVHAAAQMAQSAMLYWSSISVQQGSVAEIASSLVTAKRGSADSLVWVGSQTLPSVAGCGNLYGMGPVQLDLSGGGSVELEGVTGWTMSSNVTLEPVASDGEKENTYQGIRSAHPQVSLQMHDLDQLTGSSFGGDEFATLTLYLQKLQTTDIYVAAGTAEHIKITVNGGLRTVPGTSGSPVVLEPMFYSVQESTTPSHVFDTASAIT